jgi:UDP-N-acetylmuramoyl-tripeptide--D-alanyl-D-alanine ligase
MQIEKAAKLIEKQKKLIIIGVTGSYGKSATKDFIAEILGKKFKVLKTQGKNNTALGIANTIVKGLKNDTQVFVAEIGGYKRGEVKTVAEFIHPQIGVITGINNRYLSLFGSLENKKKANFELMQSLPKNGLAIFNGNNKDTKGLYKKTRKPKILTFTEDIQAANLIERQKTISFDVRIKNRSIHFAALHLKAQEIENLLPAIYLASYLGIKGIEIKKLVAKMRKK